jgi:hypothetical protein
MSDWMITRSGMLQYMLAGDGDTLIFEAIDELFAR